MALKKIKLLSELTEKIASKTEYGYEESLEAKDFGKVKATNLLRFVETVYKSSLSSEERKRCVDFARCLKIRTKMTFAKVAPFLESLLNELPRENDAFLGVLEIFIDTRESSARLSSKQGKIFAEQQFNNLLNSLRGDNQIDARRLEALGKILVFLRQERIKLDSATKDQDDLIIDNYTEHLNDPLVRKIFDGLRDLNCDVNDTINKAPLNTYHKVFENENFAEQSLGDIKAAVKRMLYSSKEHNIEVLSSTDLELGNRAKSLLLEYENNLLSQIPKVGIESNQGFGEMYIEPPQGFGEMDIDPPQGFGGEDVATSLGAEAKSNKQKYTEYQKNLSAIDNKLRLLGDIAQDIENSNRWNDLEYIKSEVNAMGILISFEERRYENKDKAQKFGFSECLIIATALSSSSSDTDENISAEIDEVAKKLEIDEVAKKLFSLQQGGIIIEFVDKALNDEAQELKKIGEENYNNTPKKVVSLASNKAGQSLLESEGEIWL